MIGSAARRYNEQALSRGADDTWMHADSTLDIDLAAIGRNAARFRRAMGSRKRLCGVVKADAYGLGAPAVAPVLERAGWDLLAVHRIDEALALLDDVRVPLLVLGPVCNLSPMHPLAAPLAGGRVQLTVHDRGALHEVCKLGQAMGRPVSVHVEVDTGMGRGVALSDLPGMLRCILADPRVEPAGVMTHFTAAAEAHTTLDQFRAFDHALLPMRRRLPLTCMRHCAATTATLRDARLQLDMVRIGLGWVGHALGIDAPSVDGQALEGAVSWHSHIAWVRDVSAGTALGYGSRFTTMGDARIAMVPVGYADGLPPTAMGLQVSLADAKGDRTGRGTIVGTVAMDQMLVDVTDVPWANQQTKVRLFDRESLPAVARATGLQPHHLLTAIGPRVHRRLLGGAQVHTPQTAAG